MSIFTVFFQIQESDSKNRLSRMPLITAIKAPVHLFIIFFRFFYGVITLFEKSEVFSVFFIGQMGAGFIKNMNLMVPIRLGLSIHTKFFFRHFVQLLFYVSNYAYQLNDSICYQYICYEI